MKYCKKTTLNHCIAVKYPACLEDINSLICNEGYDGKLPFFTNDEVVLDMDKAEALISEAEGRKERNKSMDMSFGISNHDSSKTNMILVELKLNVMDLYSLKKVDLEGKVLGSIKNLSSNPLVYNRYIFIVKSEKIQEAISRLFRMIPKINSNYIIMDIASLKSEYFIDNISN